MNSTHFQNATSVPTHVATYQEKFLLAWHWLRVYQTPILGLVIFVAGYLFGRIFKNSQLEDCLKSFQTFNDQEERILETQSTFSRRLGYLRKFLGLSLMMLVLYLGIVTSQNPHGSWISRITHNNQYVIVAIGVIIILFWLVGRFQSWRLKRMQSSLHDLIDQKSYFLEQFMDLIGSDMRAGILKTESRKLAERIEAENEELAKVTEEKNQLETVVKDLKKAHLVEAQKNEALDEFTSKLFTYSWCEACYDEEAIRAFVSKELAKAQNEARSPGKLERKPTKSDVQLPQSEAPASEAGEAKIAASCQKDCLVRYHIFCDQLNQDLTSKLAKIRASGK